MRPLHLVTTIEAHTHSTCHSWASRGREDIVPRKKWTKAQGSDGRSDDATLDLRSHIVGIESSMYAEHSTSAHTSQHCRVSSVVKNNIFAHQSGPVSDDATLDLRSHIVGIESSMHVEHSTSAHTSEHCGGLWSKRYQERVKRVRAVRFESTHLSTTVYPRLFAPVCPLHVGAN
jgi:hypothetical protein